MRHCCQFNADEIYCLEETELYTSRILAIGFCPECRKPVAELTEYNFAGGINKISAAGIHAQLLMQSVKEQILHSVKRILKSRGKSKPYGWRYGINREGKNGSVSQYACDFYGNKELIKRI